MLRKYFLTFPLQECKTQSQSYHCIEKDQAVTKESANESPGTNSFLKSHDCDGINVLIINTARCVSALALWEIRIDQRTRKINNVKSRKHSIDRLQKGIGVLLDFNLNLLRFTPEPFSFSNQYNHYLFGNIFDFLNTNNGSDFILFFQGGFSFLSRGRLNEYKWMLYLWYFFRSLCSW